MGKVSEDDFDSLYLHDNTVGVVDVAPQYVEAVASAMANQNPGIVFLWYPSPKLWTISAIKANKRALSPSAEEKLVEAGEILAQTIANDPRLAGRRPPGPGWFYVPRDGPPVSLRPKPSSRWVAFLVLLTALAIIAAGFWIGRDKLR